MNVKQKRNEVISIKKKHRLHELHKQARAAMRKQASFLTSKQTGEFFKAIEDGSLERLEKLFKQKPNADPNMTYFTESLLMAAIRANQNEIIDYLIDQLAINIHHTTCLREFNVRAKKKPIRSRKVTCRDLAYHQGMSEVVDLIDIISDDVPLTVKRYLIKRLETRLSHIRQTHNKRIEERNKQFLFQLNEEPPTENINDEKIISSTMLPSISQQSYRSHLEEKLQDISPPKEKTFEQTGKKTFHFSNYKLRFRLTDTPDPDNKQTSSLPPLSSLTPSRTSLIPSKTSIYSLSQISSYGSRRDIHRHGSISRSSRISIPTPIIKFSSPKQNTPSNVRYTYLPKQQPMPITFKSTAIDLTSDTLISKD